MTLVVYLALATFARAGVLFVDLNNAPKEIEACTAGAGEDDVSLLSRDTMADDKPITAAYVAQKLRELEAIGQPADSIVLSCHQGGGSCFGESGEISSTQLTQILELYPKVKRNLRSIGMVNCYGGNVDAAQGQWLLPNSNVQQIFGFPTQSPNKKAADTATLVRDYCQNRREYVKRSTAQQLCQVYPHIASLTKQSVSLCSRQAIAASAYGAQTCYTYDELHKRCAEFDPDNREMMRFMNYMAAEDPCGAFANPPVDKNSAYEGGASPLRSYYNQVHLWRHCAAQVRDDRGYDMPPTTRMIRLIKYDTIKDNLAVLNARELADYDRRLSELCLDQFKLGDITKASRAEMNYKIKAVVRALGGDPGGDDDDEFGDPVSANETTGEPTREPARAADGGCRPRVTRPARVCSRGGTDPRVVAKMAGLLQQTFVDLDSRAGPNGTGRLCTHFGLVEEDAPARLKSQCIVSYETAASL